MDQHHEAGHHEGHQKSKQITLRISAKSARIIVVVLVLAALGYYGRGLFVVASVNGSLISRLAVVNELEDVSGKQALDSLIVAKLIQAEAQKRNITATEQEINDELAKIEEQLGGQGQTLDGALTSQGIALPTLKRQLTVQKLLEKMVAEDAVVTDAEIDQFLKENKVSIPSGKDEEYRTMAKDQLYSQKLNTAKSDLVKDLRARASVNIFKQYP